MENIANALKKVSNEIERLSIKRETHLRATHGRFNLFTVLLNADDEVCLHTRYLCHLLDPKGTHDCGRLFLDSFLETVGLTHTKEEFENCVGVFKEHNTCGLGNIDIYIEFEKAVVVIENKIWAGDQDRQLERYYKYAQGKGKTAYLFYLTLYGRNPSPCSARGLEKAKAIEPGKNSYCCISYEKQILDWLEKCCQQSYSFVNINQALQQYRNVLNQLLGISLEKADMEKIKEMLKSNPEIMRHIDQIQNAIAGIKQDRENKVKSECQKFGKTVTIAHWPAVAATAFHISDESWGDAATTSLSLIMYSNGKYTLTAYDVAEGKIKRAINSPLPWTPENRSGSFYYIELFTTEMLDIALAELKRVIDKL